MKLRVVWVGKTNDPQVVKLYSDYVSRIKHFLPLDISEIKDTKGGMPAEAGKILSALESTERVVGLDPQGKAWNSDQFAKFIQHHINSDARRLTFLIGGHSGLAESVKKRADVLWSLSPLTFTHELTRVILLEQIYRALSIIHGYPYAR